jgi:dihydroorotate dehydrogenase
MALHPSILFVAGPICVFGPFLLYDIVTEDKLKVRQSPDYHRFVDHWVLPLVRKLDAENAHRAAIWSGRAGLNPTDSTNSSNLQRERDLLSVTIKGNEKRNPTGGLYLRNCVGLAAGFDKNGEVPYPLLGTGLGSVEVGSITPLPQPGNPKPRVFRLEEDQGVVNRYGFNSDGMEAVHMNLWWYRKRGEINRLKNELIYGAEEISDIRGDRIGSLGINLGKNKLQKEPLDDYLPMIERFSRLADYMVVNVSSPNTPGLRGLQDKEPLRRLLSNCLKKLDEAPKKLPETLQKVTPIQGPPPLKPPLLFVKISPDMSDAEMKDVADVVIESGVDGVIISNTTMSRPDTLTSSNKAETGGLSGKPIEELSTQQIKKFYELTDGKVPIIGVGGVSSGLGAYKKIRAGASSVQLYTMMLYEGPGVVRRIKAELMQILEEEGFSNVSECVGLDCNRLRLTQDALKEFDGTKGKREIYISVGGKIFDVTSAKQFYGPFAPYAVFAGKACTRALVLGSLEPKDLKRGDDVRGLSSKAVSDQ